MTMLSVLLILVGAALLVLAVVNPSEQRIPLLALCVSSSALGLLLLWLAARPRPGSRSDSDSLIPPRPHADDSRPLVSIEESDPGEVITPSWPLRPTNHQGPGEDGSPA